jgi:hypothetical protein
MLKKFPVVSNIISCKGSESANSDMVYKDVRMKLVEELMEAVTLNEDEQLNVKSSSNTKSKSTKKSF